MNRFPVNPYHLYRSQRGVNSQYQGNLNFKPQMPSQVLDPRFNDDNISIASESTYAPGISQDNFNNFKTDLCDMLKVLIDSTQQNFTNLIDSMKSVNSEGITAIKEEVISINKENELRFESIEAPEIGEIKEQVLLLQKENEKCSKSMSEEISKIIKRMSNMKITKKRPQPKRNMQTDPVLYRPVRKTPVHFCECMLRNNGMMTRGQLLREISKGALKCSCPSP